MPAGRTQRSAGGLFTAQMKTALVYTRAVPEKDQQDLPKAVRRSGVNNRLADFEDLHGVGTAVDMRNIPF
jgi:hypothetical protein